MPKCIMLLIVVLFASCQKDRIELENDQILKGCWSLNQGTTTYRTNELCFDNESYTERYKEGEKEFDYVVRQIGKDSYLVRYNDNTGNWQRIARFEFRHVIYLYLYYPSRAKPIIFERIE